MTEQDTEQFAVLLAGVYQTYGLTIEGEGFEYWWSMLAGYDFELIEKAFHDYSANSDYRHRCPNQGEILDRLRKLSAPQAKPKSKEIQRSTATTARHHTANILAKLGRRRSTEEVA